MAKPDVSFAEFYRHHYREDHSRPANVALHITGTVAGLALLASSVAIISPWWALAFPLVHAAPGLVGHRLFERNPAIGDIRVVGGNFPGLWYIAANHIATARVLTGRKP